MNAILNDLTRSQRLFFTFLVRRGLLGTLISFFAAAAFLLALIGLPILNYLVPEFMGQRVGGFTLTWLVLGVLFFPYVWIIARIFITRSMRLEDAEIVNAAVGNEQRKS